MCKKYGIINTKKGTPALEKIDFYLSKNGIKESIHRQAEYGGSYSGLARAFGNLDQLLSEAVLMDKYSDKYRGTVNENEYLNYAASLFSAFKENGKIYPIEFLIKDSATSNNGLYMTVLMTEIDDFNQKQKKLTSW